MPHFAHNAVIVHRAVDTEEQEKKKDLLCQKLFEQNFNYSNTKVHRAREAKLRTFGSILW